MRNLIFVFLFFASAIIVQSQSLIHPLNLDFEYSTSGQLPFAWKFNKQFQTLGYYAYATDTNSLEGKYSLLIKNIHTNKADVNIPPSQTLMAVVYQEVEAEKFHNLELIMGAKCRIEKPSNENFVLFFIQQESDVKGMSSTVMSDTLKGKGILDGSVRVLIDTTTKVIKYGFAFYGLSSAMIDDVYIDIAYDFSQNVPKVDLSQNSLQSILNLAKFYSWLKYFYPHPFIEKVNWEQIIHFYIKKAIEFNDVSKFNNLILYEFDDIINPKPTIVQKDTIKSALARVVSGLPTKTNSPVVSHKTVDVFVTNKNNPGVLLQFINISKEKPNSIELTYFYKFKKYSYNGKASVWLRIDDTFGSSLAELKSNPILQDADQWQKGTLFAEIPLDAANLRIGLVLEGNGEVQFDKLSLKIKVGNKDSILTIRNGDFEDITNPKVISGWNMPNYSQDEGYQASIVDDGYQSSRSVKISSDLQTIYKLPELLGRYKEIFYPNTIVELPLMLHPSQLTVSKMPNYQFPKFFRINERDVYSRFLILIDLYGYIRNFSLNQINENNLETALFEALKQSSTDISSQEFLKIIYQFYSISEDINFKFWNGLDNNAYLPDIGIFSNGIKTFIYGSNDKKIPDGSELISVDNTKISEITNLKRNIKYQLTKKIAQLLAGTKNSIVTLEFKTPEGKLATSKLKRTSLNLRSLNKPFYATELDTGVIYLNTTMLNDHDFKDISKQLSAEDIKAIIFDLRGYSTLSEHILGFFSSDSIQGYNAEVPIYTAPAKSIVSFLRINSNIKPNGMLKNKRIVFLTNEFTTSYSELIAYVAKKNKIGILVGEPTQGIYSDVGQIRLAGYYFGSQSFIRIKDGAKELNEPIVPDIFVEQTLDATIKGIDLQLQKAIEIIKQ